MNALVVRMKYADSQLPTATPTVARKWFRGPIRFSPHNIASTSALSRKNAKSPSIPSVCPMTFPEYFEKIPQFVPN